MSTLAPLDLTLYTALADLRITRTALFHAPDCPLALSDWLIAQDRVRALEAAQRRPVQ